MILYPNRALPDFARGFNKRNGFHWEARKGYLKVFFLFKAKVTVVTVSITSWHV